MIAYGATTLPGKLPKGVTAPRLVLLSMYSSRMPLTVSPVAKIVVDG